MDRFLALVDRLSRLAETLAVALIFGYAALMLAEVVARAQARSFSFTWEFSQYAMAAIFALAAGPALRTGVHVRISVVSEKLSPRVAKTLDVIAMMAALVIVGLICAAMWTKTSTSLERNILATSVSQTPLWIPQAVVLWGFAQLWLDLLARLIRRLGGAGAMNGAARMRRPAMLEIGLVTILLFVVLLAGSVWIGLSLFGIGYILLGVFKPNIPMDIFSSGVIWGSMIPSPLLSLPLFILMSEVLVAAGLGRSLFSGLAPWVGRLPGGLLHINVVGSTLFAAVSGSSAATTAIVGKVSLPELAARGYDRQLAMGSLAGAGTLGFLIPPSIIMIIYGVVAEQSILELFIAGVIPGLMLAVFYMAYIAGHQIITRSQPRSDRPTGAQLLRGARDIGPVAALITGIMCALYLGFASVSELAALGVLGAVLIAIAMGRFSVRAMIAAGRRAVRTSAMIGIIIIGAALLNAAFGFLGIPKAIAGQIGGWGLSPFVLIVVLLVFYAILGMFLDGTSIIVMTLPITLPLITAAGFDPIWFGIFVVVAVEISQITPPIGFNLFVIQSQTGESIGTIARAALPFFCILLGFALLLAVFPDIALWLPRTVQG